MHDVETLKVQRFQGVTHRCGQPRGFRPLDLEAVAPVSGHDEQVELGARILQVEPRGRAAARRNELTGEGGLPDLPGAQKGDDGRLSQEQRQPAQMMPPLNLHYIEI